MTTLTLERYCYAEDCTEGWLWLDDGTRLHTIERPWKPGGGPGGLPFVSCVPDGSYDLEPYLRPNGDQVLRLRNPDLGVYGDETDVPAEGGRYLVLIHAGNFVDDVVGCVAPGLDRIIHKGRPMVTSSRAAMRLLMSRAVSTLHIDCACGAED